MAAKGRKIPNYSQGNEEIRNSVAMSYLAESEAPRDFRVSSTESDGHYTKCVLCYTVKRNFYCAECVRSGNFVHSSLPYSDKFSDKQVKLMRLKLNRQHILDRCEKLLAPKIKKDILVTETKRSRDKLNLLRLAIDQRKDNISAIKKELSDLVTYNNELRLKLPRYQKRVSSLGKHAQSQQFELQKKISTFNDQAQTLAALRRSRIRQLTRYIFPVYISYDSSDSIEDMEFVGDDAEEEPPRRPQLHIVAPYIDVDGDYSNVQAWASAKAEAGGVAPWANPLHRSSAALGLCAQLLALLAWTLDVRLPHAIALGEVAEGGALRWRWAWRRVAAAGGAVVRARVSESAYASWAGALGAEAEPDEPEPPEHLSWPDSAQLELEEASSSPPAAPSLVTSAAASIASIWRGWNK
ncbi:beclin 1-associated autophagy-related key regulator [Zerene cesonia]|uniref:beclin 1-associated autophagy-related key regulator n=1 Tax=Zerene cesonia TaxID=33412 RepID=UPI0018E5082B|nr:beclin 1-associated autophagy-related key regulator [Zerene cesonia]